MKSGQNKYKTNVKMRLDFEKKEIDEKYTDIFLNDGSQKKISSSVMNDETKYIVMVSK